MDGRKSHTVWRSINWFAGVLGCVSTRNNAQMMNNRPPPPIRSQIWRDSRRRLEATNTSCNQSIGRKQWPNENKMSCQRKADAAQGERGRAWQRIDGLNSREAGQYAARGRPRLFVYECRLHRMVRPRSGSLLAHGILNSFQRLSSSSGGTSSTCVATHQMLPQGSLMPPYRSPEGKVMIGNTETPPASSAD